jgi:hypothetical protein
MALGGPRAIVYFLRSLPILGVIGVIRELDNWLNQTAPVASRGLGGAAGVDITAAATPQLPTSPEDWLGPTLSAIVDLYNDILKPALQGESRDFTDVKDWAVKLAPATLYWNRLVDTALSEDGWQRDERGRPVSKVTTADKVKLLLGTKPIRQAINQAERRYLMEVNTINRDNRRRVLDRIVQGEVSDDLRRQASDLGITGEDIKRAARAARRPINERLWRSLLKTTRQEYEAPTEFE